MNEYKYLNGAALEDRADEATLGKEELRTLHEDIGREMSRAMTMLREEDDIAARRIITDERYELKCLAHDVMNRLTRLVRADMMSRKRSK